MTLPSTNVCVSQPVRYSPAKVGPVTTSTASVSGGSRGEARSPS